MEWQPIETAPKNTAVDVWLPERGRCTDFYKDDRGRWCRKEGYPTVTRVLTRLPSHWMPLPEPPNP